jgi:3-oxoacyl-[acyl-carrier-protein] synthase-3
MQTRNRSFSFRITRAAACVPDRIETADDLAPRVGRSADWIRKYTGVDERRVSSESMAILGARAARDVLDDGSEPDLIINASVTPIQLIPDSSVFIARELGLSGIPSYSVHATCLSFVVALQQAWTLIGASAYRRILIVSAEQGTLCRDLSGAASGLLIGDGAAAVLVEYSEDGSDVLAADMTTWPEGAELAELQGFGSRFHPNDPQTSYAHNLFRMDGSELYRFTADRVSAFLRQLLDSAGVSRDDIDLVIPHQPSGPGLAWLHRWGFSADRIVSTVARYGNCIAASLPMALALAMHERRLDHGQTVLLLGVGAGISAAGVVLRW